MRQIMISLLAAVLWMAAPSAQAASNITLPATHQIISQQQTAHGTTIFAVRMTISNSGTTSLTHLSFYPIDSQLQLPLDSSLTIASLAAGATTTLNLNLEGLTPQLIPGMLLIFQGMAADMAGKPTQVLIHSRGM